MSKISYFHKPRTTPLDYRLLHDFLDLRAAKQPNSEAIVFYDRQKQRHFLNFKDWREKSTYLAASLLEIGFNRGDRVLLIAPNGLDLPVCYMALSRIGVITLLITPGKTGLCKDRVDLLTRVKCRGVVCDLNVEPSERKQLLDGLREIARGKTETGDPQIKGFVSVGLVDELSGVTEGCRVYSYNSLIQQGKLVDKTRLEDAQRDVNSDDPVHVSFTSGTTGLPKAVTVSHHALINGHNLNLDGPRGNTTKQCTFCYKQMTWSSYLPVLAMTILKGSVLVIIPHQISEEDPSCAFMLDVISQEKCLSCSLPHHLVLDLMRNCFNQDYPLPDVSSFGFGSQFVPHKVVESVLKQFPDKRAVCLYATSETFVIGIQVLTNANINSGEYGKYSIIPDTEVKIVDDNGRVVPFGTTGEVLVRSPKTFLGYLDDPKATARVTTPTVWVCTGDYGIMYEKGMIRLLGRQTDVIKKGNQVIFPIQVEEILQNHPEIAYAVVVGVPDEILRQELCACVVQVPGCGLKSRLREFEVWCDKQFAAKASDLRPRHIIFLDNLPIAPSRKIDRKAIERLAVERLRQEGEYID